MRIPGKIFGLALFLDFSDRCANTSCLHMRYSKSAVLPSCGSPEKSSGLRFSSIFPTAAPTQAACICVIQRAPFCPLAVARKNLRACAFPRFFRPLRQHKLPSSATGSGSLCCPARACLGLKLFTLTKNTGTAKRCLYFWQGQKDLNPRHAVLEWTRSYEPRVAFYKVLSQIWTKN